MSCGWRSAKVTNGLLTSFNLNGARQSAAEVAIRNFQAHFLSILAGTEEDFPLALWDCLLPQAKITLNLLRQANANPRISASAYLCGLFNYNRMPLALMGCNVQVHKKLDNSGISIQSTDRISLHQQNTIKLTTVTSKGHVGNSCAIQCTSSAIV